MALIEVEPGDYMWLRAFARKPVMPPGKEPFAIYYIKTLIGICRFRLWETAYERKTITARALDATAFAPFGDIIDIRPQPDKIINQGNCARYHDLARLNFTKGGKAGISLFDAEASPFPIALN